MKIILIFLDLDGVMVSGSWAYSPGGNGESRADSNHLRDKISPQAVAVLNRLVEETGADLVITSTTRRVMRLSAIREEFKAVGITGRVIGATPYLEGKSRGEEIRMFLDHYHKDVGGFVVLDDDNIGPELSHKLIQTKFWDGLTEMHLDKILAVTQTS